MQKTVTISRINVTLLLIYQLMAQATTSDIAHCDNTCPSNGKVTKNASQPALQMEMNVLYSGMKNGT